MVASLWTVLRRSQYAFSQSGWSSFIESAKTTPSFFTTYTQKKNKKQLVNIWYKNKVGSGVTKSISRFVHRSKNVLTPHQNLLYNNLLFSRIVSKRFFFNFLLGNKQAGGTYIIFIHIINKKRIRKILI